MILDDLNNEQVKAVKYFENPLLVLAGAGSGKTRVITYKIAYLIRKIGMDPSNILALTFTNKAAMEMKERVYSLIDGDLKNMWIGTFHHVCLRILKRHYDKVNLTRKFVIYDTNDQKKLIKNIFKDFDIDHDNSDIYAVMNGISKAKQNLKSFKQLYGDKGYGEIFNKVAEEYEKRLFENDAVDFDNMLNLTIKIFNEYEEILNFYRDKFEYVLVDEYQDTNYVQFKLIHQLTKGKNNICVVGDEDQSIYGWRGATIENILNFEENYNNARIIKLEQNYRSTKNILQAANFIIQNNENRKEKLLWTENKKGEKIQLIERIKKEDEVRSIVRNIKNLKQKGEDLKEIAIFVRTNAQTREIEKGLRNNGLPYIVIGSLKYFDRMEVKDILSYLKFYNNSRDLLSLDRIINKPRRGIGKKTKEKIFNKIDEGYSLENIREDNLMKGKILRKIDNLCTIFDNIEDYFDDSLVRGVKEIIDRSRYKNYLEKKFDNHTERWENIVELLNDISEFETKFDDVTLNDYLNDVALIQDIDLLDKSSVKDAVNILTIHKAKGLEFDNVFLSGVEDGTLPHKNCLNDPEKIEEERRLFYVAVTRARKKLFLSWAKKSYSFIYNSEINKDISRFMKEIPQEYIERTNSFSSGYGINRNKKRYRKNRFRRSKTKNTKKFKVGKKIKHSEYGVGKIIATKFKYLVVDFGDSSLKEIDPKNEEVVLHE